MSSICSEKNAFDDLSLSLSLFHTQKVGESKGKVEEYRAKDYAKDSHMYIGVCVLGFRKIRSSEFGILGLSPAEVKV